MFIKEQENGFSLVSVVVAAGLLGGLSLLIMNITKEQSLIEKRAQESQAIRYFKDDIQRVLSDTSKCSEILSGVIGGIQAHDTGELFGFGKYNINSYIDNLSLKGGESNSKVKVRGFKVIKRDESQNLIDNDVNRLNLRVYLLRESKIRHRPSPLIEDIPFTASISANQITSCSTLESNAIESGITDAVKNICDGFGGTMNNGQCDLEARIQQIKNEAVTEAINKITTDGTINKQVADSLCSNIGGTIENGKCVSTGLNESAVQEKVDELGSVICDFSLFKSSTQIDFNFKNSKCIRSNTFIP